MVHLAWTTRVTCSRLKSVNGSTQKGCLRIIIVSLHNTTITSRFHEHGAFTSIRHQVKLHWATCLSSMPTHVATFFIALTDTFMLQVLSVLLQQSPFFPSSSLTSLANYTIIQSGNFAFGLLKSIWFIRWCLPSCLVPCMDCFPKINVAVMLLSCILSTNSFLLCAYRTFDGCAYEIL